MSGSVALPPGATSDGSRGWAGALGRKVIRVFAAKLLKRVAGMVGLKAVAAWEDHKRGYRLRTFRPDDYRNTGAELDEHFLASLQNKRALLFVHGTFSRADSAFGDLPHELLVELHERYEGKVFAFDHPTLSHDPAQNVEWLRERLVDGAVLDIVCHSRGGLVARGIAGGLPDSPPVAAVKQIVFVGTPHHGTRLADFDHLSSLLDVFINLLSWLPDNGFTDALEPILEIVKEVASGAAVKLPGLVSMDPQGDFLRRMNETEVPESVQLCAIASDFRPTQPALADWAKTRIMEGVFSGSQNDLVVPTQGCFEAAGPGFPGIHGERAKRLDAQLGVAHTKYFQAEQVADALRAWLTSDLPPVRQVDDTSDT
ncbi:MAG: esterase/lipase family protein [Nannocystales bacterium]